MLKTGVHIKLKRITKTTY